MILNNKSQMFAIYFGNDYFYPEIHEKYSPIINRMKLPYLTIEDFMNSCIQDVNIPGISIDNAQQQLGQYSIEYTTGKELDAILNKDIKINFKLTETYLTYWILYDQIELYLKYGKNRKNIYWDPINITFLTDQGLELLTMEYREITPVNLSDLSLTYKSTLTQFNTISLDLHYNYIKRFACE